MSAAERREQRRAERFHMTVEAQLAEIESLRGTQARAERELAEYLDDPDWPERRETFDRFEAAGGKTAAEWAAWLKGMWPRNRDGKPKGAHLRLVVDHGAL